MATQYFLLSALPRRKTLEHKSSSLADKEQQEKELNETFKKI